MRIRIEHDFDCPLGENGFRAYWEAREALASTPPEARATQADREALAMAEAELELKMVCNCGALLAQVNFSENVQICPECHCLMTEPEKHICNQVKP